MDSFIKKIFDGKSENDILVHNQFQKYSRGEFKNKAMMNFGKSKDRYSVVTSAEFANEMVRAVAEKTGNTKVKVTGGIITTADLTGQLEFSGKKQFMGVKQYVIDKEMTGNEILAICDKFPLAFTALSFIAPDGTELKIKPKAPKSAKPSTKGGDEAPKVDFCKLYTRDKNLARAFVFDKEIDIDNVKKAEINNTFAISDIILPKGEKDFARMRELAKRKGKVLRTIKIEDSIIKKEADFLA